MPNQSDIVGKMVEALRASEPDLDTSVGTPLRKILDAVAESVAEAYTDQHLITYQYDIDSKVEGDLDDFVALFGFARIPAQRAQGVVTFSRPTDATSAAQAVIIPPGTQIMALTNPLVYVQTTVSALMNPGQTSVDVPVQAITAGAQGNVAAGLLSNVVALNGTINGAVNANPLAGGAAQESDAQLRERFKRTVFRSLAGTRAMYEAVALEIPQDPTLPDTRAISAVNVLGSTRRWREQIQIIGGTAVSTVVNAAYIFADNLFCGPDIDGGSLLTSGVNFTFTPSNPTDRSNATATIAALGGMPDGLYDLDFEYVPQASRNDPANTRFGFGGVNNRVDIWVNGQVLDTATQSVVFQATKLFSASNTSPYFTGRFTQENSDSAPNPAANNVFIPLAYGPIISVPTTLTVSGVTYVLGTDYWVVHQNDCFGYGSNSLYGLAWLTTRKPANGSVFSISYTYNKIPWLLQDAITQWRLVGTDARAHAGKRVLMKFNLAVMYDRRFDVPTVNTQIDQALASFLSKLGFAAPVQVSDILQTVHNVPGVDNVRFLTSNDNGSVYAISRMSVYQNNVQLSVYALSGRAIDVQLADDQYPVFHSTNIVAKAANSFGVG